ncbi:DsbA family protein, partial [Acidobacteria bacterium AH-259-G07]|nr:DsbA family protein [Acidobacteria bacterium AH-259-G07]
MPQIKRDYIATGKLKYVFHDFPLVRIHKFALKAAEAARCAREQGKYWEMHDRLFANYKALSRKDLGHHAQAVGLDLEKFQLCLDSGRYTPAIQKDMAEAAKVGVNSTPHFFLGFTNPRNSKVKVSRVLRGASPYSNFKQAIDSLLAS